MLHTLTDTFTSLTSSIVNSIGRAGTKVIHDTLVHPDGPKFITSLKFAKGMVALPLL